MISTISTLASYLVAEWYFRKEKERKKRVWIISIIIVVSGVIVNSAEYYEKNSPQHLESEFNISLDDAAIFPQIGLRQLSSEEDYISYGTSKLINWLADFFVSSWLPTITTVSDYTYINPMPDTEHIDEFNFISVNDMKAAFKDNEFVQRYDNGNIYFRIATPRGMKLSTTRIGIRGLKHQIISIENIKAKLTFELSYLQPSNVLHGRIYLDEKLWILFSPKDRVDYKTWYQIIVSELKERERRQNDLKAYLNTTRNH